MHGRIRQTMTWRREGSPGCSWTTSRRTSSRSARKCTPRRRWLSGGPLLKSSKALGELFTPGAEIEGDDGELTRGRDAIVDRFAKMFSDGQGGTLSVTTGSLRFLTK